MNKDLIYRTCSLETVRLAQAKGLEEEHNYYSQYPDKVAFTLRTSTQICLQNGLHNNRNPLCLMRLQFARCRRSDKAPARRFVCKTVLHNNRNHKA